MWQGRVWSGAAHLVLLPWLVFWLVPGVSAASDHFQSIWIDDLELAEAYSTVAGTLARASSRSHPGEFLIRSGDLLADGFVERILFLSPRLAVVRLEQRVWPPSSSGPYREVLRVLGWQRIVGAPATASSQPEALSESLPESLPEGMLLHRAGGHEGVGSWPHGRYRNRGRRVVGPVMAGRPRVDLFALYFFEKHGLWPWQHSAWNGSWQVPIGYPLRASIAGVDDRPVLPDAADSVGEVSAATWVPKRDPFRSLFAPWSLQERFVERFRRLQGTQRFLIEELELVAVYHGASGPWAEFAIGVTLRPFILRPGDALWDGEVVSITSTSPQSWYQRCGEVVFKQSVWDP